MSSIHRLFGASAWLFADRFIRLGLSFVVGVLIARHFGPVEFGQITFVVATAGVFGSLSSLGLDDLVPKDMAQNQQPGVSVDDMQHTALVMRLFGGSLSYCLLLVAVWWTGGLGLLFWLALILGPYFLLQATDVYEYRLRVEGGFGKIARVRTLASVGANLLKVIVVWLSLPLAWLAATMTSEFGFNALFFRKIAAVHAGWGRGQFRIDYAKQLLGRSWKIILAGVLMMVQSRIEYFLVEHFLGWDSVGQYAAALKVVELFDVVAVILVTIMLPEFARKYHEAPERTVRQGYLLGCASFALLMPLMATAVWLFPIVYGEQFAPAFTVLSLFMLRPFFIMVNSVRNMLLVIENKFWYPPFCAAIGVAASLGFGSYLIPLLGLWGAVLSAVLSLLASTFLADLIANRKNLFCFFSCWREIKPLYQSLKNA